jgi:hypothetical protein
MGVGKTIPDESAQPSLVPDATEALLFDQTALEIVATARTRLIDVELMLRDFWYDSVDRAPEVAARINIATRLAHQAASRATHVSVSPSDSGGPV